MTGRARRAESFALRGRYVALSPLDPAVHAGPLYAMSHGPGRASLWRFLRDGPFADLPAYRAHLDELVSRDLFMPFVIVASGSGEVVGKVSLIRFCAEHRSIEIAYVLFSPVLQGTRGGTEALYLLVRHAFEHLGCRRCEWRSDTENQASIRAALRFGFREEGVLRRHMIVKAHSRDTAVLSLLDLEWPARKTAIDRWLAPTNFDTAERQISSLQR